MISESARLPVDPLYSHSARLHMEKNWGVIIEMLVSVRAADSLMMIVSFSDLRTSMQFRLINFLQKQLISLYSIVDL